jgi:hypothetical protein
MEFLPGSCPGRVIAGWGWHRPGPSRALYDTGLGRGRRRGMLAPVEIRIAVQGVMEELYSLSSPKTVCAW